MHNKNNCCEYIIAFSSHYKAMYARDELRSFGISSVVRRTPPGLCKTCGYSLYISGHDIRRVSGILCECQIMPQGIYQIIKCNGKTEYHKMKF